MKRKPTPTEIVQFCRDIKELCDRYQCHGYFKSYNGEPGGETFFLDQVRILRSTDLRGGMIYVQFHSENECWGIWASCIHEFRENLEEKFLNAMMEYTFNP